MRYKYFRTIMMGGLLIALAACSSFAIPAATTQDRVTVAPGRYAVQWEGYLAGYADESLLPTVCVCGRVRNCAGSVCGAVQRGEAGH